MRLTSEEEKIVALVVLEKTDLEISDETGYAERTIRKKLQKLYERFGVKTRQGLVREAVLMKLAEGF